MSKYDYEIANYCVEWDFTGVYSNEKKFETEDDAIEFAKEKCNEGYNDVKVYQKRNIVGW
jgi:hypothetical protein